MRVKIGKKDINGIDIKLSDLVAESSLGKIIWDGTGEIIERPVGLVYKHDGVYNLKQIKTGKVKILEPYSEKNMRIWNGEEVVDIYLSCHDGVFYNWEEVEVVAR